MEPVQQVQQVTQTVSPILEVLVQLALIVIPALITWFIRNYVKGTSAEREVSAIVHLANAAIDYVENLDKRGDIVLTPGLSKGTAKLSLAAEWLEKELERAGITITDEQAMEWVSSQFQKRVGDVKMVGTMAQVAIEALDLVERLVEGGLVKLPEDTDRFLFLCRLAADWMVMQMAERGAAVTPEEALTWVRAELLKRLNDRAAGGAADEEDDLDRLIAQALAFLEELRAGNRLPAGNVDAARDLATAWILTEVAKRGLNYTPVEIAAAVRFALPRG
jgi:hypothetical protein